MTENTAVDALDVPEYHIQHIQHPDTGLAVRIEGHTYVPDPETETVEAGRYHYNSWDGVAELVLAVTDEAVLVTTGVGDLDLRTREEFVVDQERIHPLREDPDALAPRVDHDDCEFSVETEFGTVTVTLEDSAATIPTAATTPWCELPETRRAVALLWYAVSVLDTRTA
ncbi:hypothetical protein [Halorubellus sp. PRR65]|uniref:hypothetical protein n=1 Tax=Halorubellus sp. PRR65 TaxID=3098148 RepID=UPI002B263A70|nr:hypothetical protein [Halorubellus sp. PRR65]